MQLLLIRHAQTTSNVAGLLDSRVPGANLTRWGRRQAAALPAALERRPISSITVSNMIRTSQTAAPLARNRHLVPIIDAGVREIEGGELEMASGMEAYNRYVGAAWAWARGELAARMPGAQDGYEFFNRFDTAVDRALETGGQNPVIFSHGASIRVWVGHRCTNVTSTFAPESELHNTGAALIERDEAGVWTLVEWTAMPLGGAKLHAPSGPVDSNSAGTFTQGKIN